MHRPSLRFLVVSWTILIVVLSHCRPRKDASLVKDHQPRRPVIVLIGQGGWGSCAGDQDPDGSRIYDSFRNLLKDLRRSADVHYMIGCLPKISPVRQLAKVYYSDSLGYTGGAGAREEYPKLVREFIEGIRPDKVYFIGHSYGGWVVLDLLRRRIVANSTFTMDPIDAQNCTIADNLFYFVGVEARVCQRPPDMNYSVVLESTATLYNFWQQTGPIHSLPIDPEDRLRKVRNIELDVEHSVYRGDARKKREYSHRMIGAYPYVWGMVCREISRLNGFDEGHCTMIDTNLLGEFVADVNEEVPAMP